ncbi:lipid II flippase MurJ [Ornithinimicrobium tianjinense]|uniref:Membrane protein n=1 Tax=Ornithinimicrobium tianjinense TaxID=1195761 RepID=A0A917BLJ0_9MICO|nr:lipid II flippase MurJ [Ornithinimicrobium tianjinense]GGF48623.1 membrane protein [Ornithinimicrobium tianjinense]
MTGAGPSPSARLGTGGLVGAAALVAAVTLAARAVGLVRWFVFSHAVGATCVGQVYTTANTVPNVLFEVAAGGALAAVAVPLVAAHLQRGDEDAADRTASALATWSLTVLLPLAALVALAAGPITVWLLGDTAGCDPAAMHAAGRLMLLLFAPQVVLYGIGIVLAGVLQAHRRFLAAAVAPLLSSVVVIGVYLGFGAAYDPTVPLQQLPAAALWLLAGGTTVGVVALSLPLLVPAARLGVRWRPTWRFPDGTGRRAGALVVAGVAAVAAQQLTSVVVLLLTNAATGVAGITVWTYAQTAYLLPYAVLVVPLATAAFPRLAGGGAEAVRVLRGALLGAVVASLAAAVALVAVRREVGALFVLLDAGSGGAGRRALESLPLTVALLAPGLLGFAVLAVGTRALYAVGSPRRAAAATAAGWGVAALVPLLVVGRGADVGTTLAWLAAGSSVGMTVAGLLLVREVRGVWGPAATAGLGRAAAGCLAGALTGVLLREQLLPTDVSAWWPLVLVAAGGGGLVLAGAAGGLRLAAPQQWRVVSGRLSR